MQALSATTTLTLHTVASTDRLERSRFQPNSIPRLKHSSNKNKAGISNREVHTSSSYIKCQSFDAGGEKQPGIDDNNSYSSLSKVEDAVLLGRSQSEPTTMTASLLHKSSSCHAMLKPKSTVITQDGKNGRINTNSADNEKDFSISLNTEKAGAVHELDFSEQDAFLLDDSGTSSSSRRAASNSTSRRSSLKSNSLSICYRIHGFINRNWHLSYLVPFSILLALLFVAYLTRGYATQLLYWIETQDPWMMFAVFVVLFIIVSFPVAVGYFVLMITSGYLFGCIKGLLTVMLGANLGIAIAHVTIRSVRHRIPMHKLIKNETGRAILRVISGPRAFRVVLFTRLTPIPFGIQNVIFGVSSIKPRIYHTATFLGLLPAQTINVYLGSTLRSMHEVLNNHGTALTGYISFGVEAICGIALMFWVVQKARKELSETLLSDISNDGKLINMQV